MSCILKARVTLLTTAIVAMLAVAANATIVMKVDFNEYEITDSVGPLDRYEDTSGFDRDGFSAGNSGFTTGPAAYGSTTAAALPGNVNAGFIYRPGFAGFNDIPPGDPASSSSIAFGTDSSFTIEMVIQTEASEANNPLVTHGGSTSSTPQWWSRLTSNGKVQFLLRDVDSDLVQIPSVAAVNDGEWHHLALIHDQANKKLLVYIDHALDNQITYSPNIGVIDPVSTPSSPIDVRIGFWQKNPPPKFGGNIDFAYVHDKALIPSEFVQPVPEPSTFVLLAMALCGLVGFGYTKRR